MPTDAAPSVTDAADATHPFSCADVTGVELCADFDQGPLDLFWDETVAHSGGDAAVDMQVFLSPPASFRSSKTATTSGYAYAILRKTFARTSYSRLRIEFDIRIDRFEETGTDIEVLDIIRGVAFGQYYRLTLQFSKTRGRLVEQVPRDGGLDYGVHPLSFPPAPRLGAWTHVLLALELPAGDASSNLRLMFDGADKLMSDGGIGINAHRFSGATVLAMGLYFISPSAAWDVWFDNVVVRMD